jgi:hypothetical protein
MTAPPVDYFDRWFTIGASMTPKGPSSPVWIGRDEVEREFAETLRQAAWIFENEKDGRFSGSIAACRAVARFIRRRGGGAELAGPFGQIAAAFEGLQRGVKPRLFAKKTEPEKKRERSPERKHAQKLAVVVLDVLVKLGDGVDVAARHCARHVGKWPGMGSQGITELTLINWRKQKSIKEREGLLRAILKEPDPRAEVERLLREGPPGLWKS